MKRTKRLSIFGLVLVGLVFLSGVVLAEPTTPDRVLSWDPSAAPDLAGYRIYWAPETESPRVYSDARRAELADPTAVQVLIVDITTINSSTCFKITAFDLTGNESGFSNEACGWFGMSGPINLLVGS